MKKLVLSLAIFGFASVAMAQETGKQDTPVQKMGVIQKRTLPIERMETDLKLTDVQKEQIKALKEKPSPYQAEMKKLRERQMELRTLQQKERDAEMKKILTPEQYTTWSQHKAKKAEMHKKPGFKDRKSVK